MARGNSVEDLVEAWPSGALSRDPVARHSIEPSIAKRLSRPTARQITPEQRMAMLEELLRAPGGAAGAARRVRFAIRPRPAVAAIELPAGEFDVVASLRLEVANDVLAGLYASVAWPRDLPPGEVALQLSLLRALSNDVPDDADLEVGSLHLTGPPTIEIGPAGLLRLAQAIRLDVDGVRPTFPRRTTVTSLSALLKYDVMPRATETEPGVVTIELDRPRPTGDVEISPDSLIQPRSPQALATFTDQVLLILTLVRNTLGPWPLTILPDIHLPFDDSVPVRILAARAGTSETELGAGALHIGVMVGFSDDAVAPAVADVVTLNSDPLGRSAANVVVSVHAATLEAAGAALADFLRDSVNDHVPHVNDEPVVRVLIDGIHVELRPPDTIRFVVAAHLPNVCLGFIDLDFDAIIDVETNVVNGTVYLKEDSEIDYSNGDVAVCAITSLLDILFLRFPGIIIAALARPVLGLGLSERAGDLPSSFTGVFDPRAPIPLTELAPRAEVLQVAVADDRVELRGAVTLQAATDDYIFGYVVVRERLLGPVLGGPIKGARVSIMDQDAPTPPEDDFVPPEIETPIILRGQTMTIRNDYSIRAAVRDEVIATATTNREGRARFAIERATAGGVGATLITRQTARRTDRESDPVRTIIETPLREELPDVYLLVTLPNGGEIDSRFASGMGLQINLAADYIGTATAPITVGISREMAIPDRGVGRD